MTTINVTFSGLATGIRPTIDSNNVYSLNNFSGKPYTAEFIFDTDFGTLSDHRLDGGLVSASLMLEGIIPWGSATQLSLYGPPLLLWNDDLSGVVATVGGTYYHLGVGNAFSPNGHYGVFQFGLCPTVIGGPCGYMTSAELVSATGIPLVAVPSPLVGTGISSLILTFVIVRSLQCLSNRARRRTVASVAIVGSS